jgi:hypothetical protein
MPDPVRMLEAAGAAMAVAALVLLACGWPRRTPRPVRSSVGAVVGVGAGLVAGCWVLGLWPHWPPREDQDRFLALVLPAVFVAELLSASGRIPRWLAWLVRLALAAAAARVLLHDTSYLTDLAGPGTREWTPAQAAWILGGLAVVLAVVWVALAYLAVRAAGAVPLAGLALACAGAGLAVMLSGYATGGQLGVPLAAALGGSAAAALVLRGPSRVAGALGVGVVGLFCLLLIGRFFGQLRTAEAVLLFAAPLLSWLPELPYPRRPRPWLRGLLAVALVAVPVAVVVVRAQRQFVADSATSGGPSTEPTLQDYMDFGR